LNPNTKTQPAATVNGTRNEQRLTALEEQATQMTQQMQRMALAVAKLLAATYQPIVEQQVAAQLLAGETTTDKA
jgi:hypothetical protein